MSKSSLATNRLLHISDLPNVQRYSSIDINRLLPVHFSTLRQNVLTMIYYQVNNFDKKMLVHDPNLTIYSTSYPQIRGGWCQDFDHQEQTSQSFHVKKSIQIGVVILNYLQAITQARTKNNKNNQVQMPDNKIILKTQCFQNYKIKSNIQLYPQKVKGAFGKQSTNLKNQFLFLDMQKHHQSFSDQTNLVIAYNIYKKNKKYIFLTGISQNYTENFFNSLSLFRNWNLSRLNVQKKLNITFDKLSRSGVFIQHLFSIARGFIFSSFQHKKIKDPFVPFNDINDNKKHLKQIIDYFDIQKDLQDSSQLILQQVQNEQIFSVLQDTIKIYRFCLTYKMQNQNQEQKVVLMSKMTTTFSKILQKIITDTPININVSYYCESKHNVKTNQLFLIFILNYKSNMAKHLFLSAEQVKISIKNLTSQLNKSSYGQIQKSQKNIADEVFKSSYRIYNKYSQVIDKSSAKTFPKEFEDRFSGIKLAQSMIKSYSKNQLSYSTASPGKPYTPPLYNGSKSQQQEVGTLSQGSTIFSKSIGYSQIQVEYKKLINSIQQKKQANSLLNPIDLKDSLKSYLQPFNLINRTVVVTLQKHEKFSLNFVGICCEYLDAEDISKVFIKYEDNAQAICDFFMQENNFQKMVRVAKNFNQQLESIFKSYINQGNGFKNVRHNLLVNYLKKLVQKYYVIRKQTNTMTISRFGSQSRKSLRESPLKNLSKQKLKQESLFSNLDINSLISLLQKKSANIPEYKNLVSNYFNQIFLFRPEAPFISTVLHGYYVHLQKDDHHQDLVSSFIAQIYFQIIYFTDQLTSISLNNSRYRKNLIDMKEKKFFQVIREVGFLNFGHQVRTVLIPKLIQCQQFVSHQNLIVSTIRIGKPKYFKIVLKMIQNSFFSQNFSILSTEIRKRRHHLQKIDKQVCMPVYRIQLLSQIKNGLLQSYSQTSKQENQQTSINIELSQSGIFRELMSLNPGFRMAGKNIKQQHMRRVNEQQLQQNRFTQRHFLSEILSLNIQQAWQYIQLSQQLKQKFIQIQSLNKKQSISTKSAHLQNDLIYLRQTIQHIYSKLTKVYQYLALSDLLYNINKSNVIKLYNPDV